jgi:hypothetical protein
VALLLGVLLGGAAHAQAAPQPVLAVHVYQLKHQSASDAMHIVVPLLSPHGTVELRPGDNTLEVRDTVASLQRILPVLYAFDHPAEPVDIEIWLVRASDPQVSPPMPVSPKVGALPAELLKSLRASFPFHDYSLVGRSNVSALEGEQVTFQIGGDFAVRFRLGTIVGAQRLRLNDFEVMLQPDTGDPVSLLKSQLNLWLDRTMAMGMTAGQGSHTALLVVVRCAAGKARAQGRR